MANFNLNDYETVEERLKRFYADNPHGRVVTENLTTAQDRERNTWVVKAEIWLPTWSLPKESYEWIAVDHGSGWFLKATGLAFEIDGGKMANATSALENCETSAIGRALANANYSGNKRATREEMQKVERGISPARDWKAEIAGLTTEAAAMQLWNEARTQKAPESILVAIKTKGKSLAK